MIQDWGYNYLYLRQTNATTRIDLRDHSFRDVVNTPVKDFVSTINDDITPSWLIQEKPLWFCESKDECGEDVSEKSSDGYVPEPFPENELEPYGWHDILATLDVCANVHNNVHCDEEGYDICSLKMLSVMQEIDESELSGLQENAKRKGQLVENSEDDSLNSRETRASYWKDRMLTHRGSRRSINKMESM